MRGFTTLRIQPRKRKLIKIQAIFVLENLHDIVDVIRELEAANYPINYSLISKLERIENCLDAASKKRFMNSTFNTLSEVRNEIKKIKLLQPLSPQQQKPSLT